MMTMILVVVLEAWLVKSVVGRRCYLVPTAHIAAALVEDDLLDQVDVSTRQAAVVTTARKVTVLPQQLNAGLSR
jgi:hypothetical protein